MKSRRSSNSSWRLSTFLRRNSRRYGRRATNVLGLCTGCCERYRMARRSLDGRTGGLAAYGLRLTGYSWLLLSQAVQRPQPPHQIDSMDPNDWAIADQFGEQPERSTVVRIIERRHENHVVGDVEIRIARREPLALEGKRRRHRQGDDFDFRAVLEPHPLEPLAILPQRPVVRVAGIRLAAQHHGSRIDEAAQVVHMAVGIVAGDPPPEPQQVRHAEVVAQRALQLRARQAGVPHLDRGVEQTLFGGEERAPAVDVDAPTLQHDIAVPGPSTQQPQAEPFRNPFRHLVVPFPVGVFRPGVEAEAGDGDLGARALTPHEQGAVIARPPAVGREAEEFDARGVDTDPFEYAPGLALVRGRIHENTYDLARHELANDLAVYPRDRCELARPIARVVRPPDPGGVVRLPLGGHAEAQGGWNGAVSHQPSAVSDFWRRADG